MYNISNYNNFLLNNKLNESVLVNHNDLLKYIDAKKRDLYKMFPCEKTHDNIEELYNDNNFNKDLLDKNYSKSKLEYSKDYDTYLKSNDILKFFTISNKKYSNLDVIYIVIQTKNKDGEWGEIELYRIKKDIRRFYDGLSTRTIEIKDGDSNYIYITSNSGNNWKLKNMDAKNDVFKEELYIEELRSILSNKKYIMNFVE